MLNVVSTQCTRSHIATTNQIFFITNYTIFFYHQLYTSLFYKISQRTLTSQMFKSLFYERQIKNKKKSVIFRKKVHAQRKFAHGSHPSTPSETPSKPRFKASPVRLFPVRPKTEDFLTYLCFRGRNLFTLSSVFSGP